MELKTAHYKLMKTRGVTLIELLITVTIIVIFAGLAVVYLNPEGARSRVRDARRVDDLNLIRASLELYLADNGVYPACPWEEVEASSCLSLDLGRDHLTSVPLDPKYEAGGNTPDPCVDNPSDNYRYNYVSTDGNTFVLTAILENATGTVGHECNLLPNWPSGLCVVPVPGCYGVQNP